MRNRIIFAIAISLGAAAFAIAAPRLARQTQDDKSQRPSPPAHAECKFPGGSTISIDDSSPRMRGRKIFGELVPYGEGAAVPLWC